MSMADHISEPLQIVPDAETLHAFHRQQLSAMLDGELSPDEAKFMLRRLEHDVELARCWERWQVCGEVLRGRAGSLLPGDFAAQVAVAIQAPPARTAHRAPLHQRPRAWMWGGAAMAASLALVAAALVLRAPESDVLPAPTAPMLADADAAMPVALPEVLPQVADAAPAPAPVPVQARRRAVQAVPASSALAAATEPSERALRDLLLAAHTAPAPLSPRPWPRAGVAGRGLTVGYGTPAVRPADPFQPRWIPPPPVLWPEPDPARSPAWQD